MKKESTFVISPGSLDNIIAIKLVTGEELLASYLGEIEEPKNNKAIAIIDPMVINETDAGIKLNKYMKFSDSKIVVLKNDKIISIGTVPITVSNVYKSALRFYNEVIVSEIDKELVIVNKALLTSLETISSEPITLGNPSPKSVVVPGTKSKH